MKINKKALELIEKGLSSKTVSNLVESEINILHSRLTSEATDTVTKQRTYSSGEVQTMKSKGQSIPGGKSVKINTDGSMTVTTEGETDEDVEITNNPNKETETQNPKQVGPSTDDGFGDYDDGMGMFESDKNSNKKKINPWAICHAQVGPKKNRKFERCVQSVKKQLKEGKNPVSLLIENQIMKIVEKNLPPRITKGDLIKYLSEDKNYNYGNNPSSKMRKVVDEQNPAVAPTKPKTNPSTKPGTKPGTKPQKPAHPGKNPNPGEQPSPKAKTPSAEETKDKVIDVILNLLQK
jgi:hypothetical protein